MPTKEAYKRSMSYSRTGFWLSMIGAGLIILQGLIAMFFSSIVFGVTFGNGVGISIFFLGIILVLLGVIVYSSTYALTRTPDEHVISGAAIFVFSLIALGLGGGYLVGSILGMIGGVVVIVGIG